MLDIIRSLALVFTVSALHVVAQNANIADCESKLGWIENPNIDCSPLIYCRGPDSMYCLADYTSCAETCAGLRVETNIPECVAADAGYIANPNTDCSPWIYCRGPDSVYCLADYTTCAATCAELPSNIPECVSKPVGFIVNPDKSCSPYILCNGRESMYCYVDGTCAAECVLKAKAIALSSYVTL